MFPRTQSPKLQALSKVFPVICLIGPRQAGKTTLAKDTFPGYRYVSLEDPDHRAFAQSDPRGFLSDYAHHVIIDEAQHAPDLFSYLQTHVDTYDTPGQYILTGSAHLTLLKKLSQSLAGRAALLKLLPLSVAELKAVNYLKTTSEEQLFFGFYPRIYKSHIAPVDWYPNYIQTYLEKDVREILNIKDLNTFRRFMGLCAGRHGQLLEISSLASDCGISRTTCKEWLTVLEASFLIYLLPPFHNNYNKRLIKSPKLYFYDTGLVCSLLKIESNDQLKTHYHRGALFEGYVITELIKQRYNQGLEPNVTFWREHHGNEVDCIIEYSGKRHAIEIKAGKTIANDFFKGLRYWQTLTGDDANLSYLIYGGDIKQQRSYAQVLPWYNVDMLSIL